MRKNNINEVFSHSIKKLLPFLLFSCVYYNTFYNAEVNYKKAEKIIQQTPSLNSDDNEIPSQAKKLLNDAIGNCNIVINKYSDSKYVDDAYFIMGKASFLTKEFFNAQKYLNKIIELYPNSEYYHESQIWLGYTYLRLNDLELAKNKLEELKNLENDNYQYLINNILAEISIKDNLHMDAYNYYNKCLHFTNNKPQKASIYLKLLNISENNQDLDSSIIYLNRLAQYGDAKIKKDVKLDWIKYSRKLQKFDELLVEIEKMLGLPEYSSIYIKIELERAKAYMDQKDYESAKIFLNELSEKYTRKNESAEALYHLGYIALMENFDIDLATEYFEKSKKDRKTSVYGKQSRDMINKINDYKNLKEELEIALKEESSKNKIDNSEKETASPQDTLTNSNNEYAQNLVNNPALQNSKKGEELKTAIARGKRRTTPDSIIFVMSEKLLFDFDRLNEAKTNYKRLIEGYPDSKFRPQSLYVLNHYFPDDEWGNILKEEYPNSKFNLTVDELEEINENSIESIRDNIWSTCDLSYNLCATAFLHLYHSRQDNLSLYYYGFINDNYLNKIEEAVNSYKDYIKKNEDVYRYDGSRKISLRDQAILRLNEIEDYIHSQTALTDQKINYYHAIESLQSGEELDSVLSKTDKAIGLNFSKYKSSAQLIKSRINKLISLNKEITAKIDVFNDTLNINNSNLDSLYFIVGKIYQLDFMMNDSAEHYFKNIVNNFSNSDFKYESLVSLSNINNDNLYWKNILLSEYPDSIYMIDSSYKEIEILNEIYNESFIVTEINKLELLNSFSVLFENEKDSISALDTINIDVVPDTLNKVFETDAQ